MYGAHQVDVIGLGAGSGSLLIQNLSAGGQRDKMGGCSGLYQMLLLVQ